MSNTSNKSNNSDDLSVTKPSFYNITQVQLNNFLKSEYTSLKEYVIQTLNIDEVQDCDFKLFNCKINASELKGKDISGVNFINCKFEGDAINSVNAQNCIFENCELPHAIIDSNLKGTIICRNEQKITLENCEISNSVLVSENIKAENCRNYILTNCENLAKAKRFSRRDFEDYIEFAADKNSKKSSLKEFLKRTHSIKDDNFHPDFSGEDLSGFEIGENCDFSGSVFDGALMHSCEIKGAKFTNCSMNNIDAQNQGGVFSSGGYATKWVDVDFTNSSLVSAKLIGNQFESCTLTHTDFRCASITKQNFSKCITKNAVSYGAGNKVPSTEESKHIDPFTGPPKQEPGDEKQSWEKFLADEDKENDTALRNLMIKAAIFLAVVAIISNMLSPTAIAMISLCLALAASGAFNAFMGNWFDSLLNALGSGITGGSVEVPNLFVGEQREANVQGPEREGQNVSSNLLGSKINQILQTGKPIINLV